MVVLGELGVRPTPTDIENVRPVLPLITPAGVISETDVLKDGQLLLVEDIG